MKKLIARVALIAVLPGMALISSAAPAQAASTAIVGYTNCNGSAVYYDKERKLSSLRYIDLSLTVIPGDADGDRVAVGVRIKSDEPYKSFTPAKPKQRIVAANKYAKGTKFKMYAWQQPSRGTCYNEWGGTLTY